MKYALVYPMAAMVLLTFVILIVMFRGRVRAVRDGTASVGFYKTYQEGSEPRSAAQLSRHYVNLFETPTLFYVACIIAMVIGQTGTAIVALAWAYVVARVAHALIHTGSNKLQARMRSYMVSCAILFAMWTLITIGVATA